MDSSGESLDTCFFVNYKRGLTLSKTELDPMSKRKLTTKFKEEPLSFGTGMWNVGLTPNMCRCTLPLPTSCMACLVGTGRTASGRWPATYVSCDESAVSELKRYASFIATSNHSDLLSDPSGSRRFICINITGRIRNDAVINYLQLYAQVAQELREGERFYFSPEEEAVLMENNQEFELQTPVGHLFQQYFRSADEGEKCETLLAVDILGRIQKKSGFKLSATKIVHLGRILRKLGVPCKKMRNGNFYCVVEL